jgi:hypothetical protein
MAWRDMVGDRAHHYARDRPLHIADLTSRGRTHADRSRDDGPRDRAGYGAGTPAATGDAAWLTHIASEPDRAAAATGIDWRKQGWDQWLIEATAAALIDARSPDLPPSTICGRGATTIAPAWALSTHPHGPASTFARRRERIITALHEALKKIADDPDDPLRRRLVETLAALPERLRTDPALAARIEGAKEELLASPAVARLLEDAAVGLRKIVIADLAAQPSEVVSWITARLDRARQTLADDTALRTSLDRWLKERLGEVVDRYHDRIAHFIERGVHALGPEGAVRLIEEHAGDDLQYIRVNGTVVGGLAGGGLYAIHLLLDLLW